MLKNYRLVSNLPFVAKATEKAVINQLMGYCTINRLTSMDRQIITFLILIDLSAAFDTINHSLMIDILEKDFGIAGVVKK